MSAPHEEERRRTLRPCANDAAGRRPVVASSRRSSAQEAMDGRSSSSESRVSSLDKVFFLRDRITKGDMMRYYARVEEAVLPVMRDRPLVLKRYPDGIDGQAFYQQKAPDKLPPAVRVETIRNEQGEQQRRFIGGDLATLLYTVQLGAISVDTWHSRVPKLELADFTILDLDPGPKASFARVVEVAMLVKEELDALELTAVPKTSGSSGMHIVVPLRPGVSDDTAVIAAQLIATRVAARAPSIATIERSWVRERRAPSTSIISRIRAKTVAQLLGAGTTGRDGIGALDGRRSCEARPTRPHNRNRPDRLRRHGDIGAAT